MNDDYKLVEFEILFHPIYICQLCKISSYEIGGITGNHNGDLITAFSSPMYVSSALEAKIAALLEGAQVMLQVTVD